MTKAKAKLSGSPSKDRDRQDRDAVPARAWVSNFQTAASRLRKEFNMVAPEFLFFSFSHLADGLLRWRRGGHSPQLVAMPLPAMLTPPSFF